VIIVERPAAGAVPVFETLDGILAWIEAHRGAP
jgi:hypothetical protein